MICIQLGYFTQEARNWLLPRCTISNRTSPEEDGVLEINAITSTPRAKLEEIQQCTNQDLYLPTSKMMCSTVGNIIQMNAPKTKESFGISERIWFWIWNGLILKRHHLVITSKVCPQMLQIIHQGHMGMEKCHLKAKESLFWLGISRDIKELTANCATWIQQPKETLCPLSTLGFPWQKLGCDLFDYKGAKYFLVADKGHQYSSWEFAAFCNHWGINHITSSPLYPKSNRFREWMV